MAFFSDDGDLHLDDNLFEFWGALYEPNLEDSFGNIPQVTEHSLEDSEHSLTDKEQSVPDIQRTISFQEFSSSGAMSKEHSLGTNVESDTYVSFEIFYYFYWWYFYY